jgi:uncharacterized protein YsxB (DUF464 family)
MVWDIGNEIHIERTQDRNLRSASARSHDERSHRGFETVCSGQMNEMVLVAVFCRTTQS